MKTIWSTDVYHVVVTWIREKVCSVRTASRHKKVPEQLQLNRDKILVTVPPTNKYIITQKNFREEAKIDFYKNFFVKSIERIKEDEISSDK